MNPKVMIVEAPVQTMEKTKFSKDKEVLVTRLAVEISKKPDYRKELDEDDFDNTEDFETAITRRKDDNIRTWTMNNKSVVHLMSKFGENEQEWIKHEIELEIKQQLVKGKNKNVVYVKGAV